MQSHSPPPPIRVILADDHPIVRSGIRAELERIPGVEVLAEASDGREAIALVASLKPQVVFMDISMRGLNGLEATARITRDFPGTRVVILSKAVRAGASGYVLKKAATAELSSAVKRAIGGELYLSREISGRLLKKLPLQQLSYQKTPLEQLTERQREILQLIAEGQTTKEIAYLLKVSPKTIEYHRMQLMQRLNIFDIPGLVRFALQNRLISQEP